MEDVVLLHTYGAQAVDVEEPAIVDLLRGHAPVGKAENLFAKQAVEKIKAPGISLVPVQEPDVLGDVLHDLAGQFRESR